MNKILKSTCSTFLLLIIFVIIPHETFGQSSTQNDNQWVIQTIIEGATKGNSLLFNIIMFLLFLAAIYDLVILKGGYKDQFTKIQNNLDTNESNINSIKDRYIKEIVIKLRATKRDVLLMKKADAIAILDNQKQILYDNFQTSLSWVNFAIYGIPTIGFLGTVVGISLALGKTNEVFENLTKPNVLKIKLSNVTSELGVAFYTTLFALLLSLILVAFKSYREHQFEKHFYNRYSDLLPEIVASSSEQINQKIREMRDTLTGMAGQLTKLGGLEETK